MERGFVSTMRKGFQMTFKNGLTVSVQWGTGNYCDNYSTKDINFNFKSTKDEKSSNAEIAVIYNAELLDPQHFTNEEICVDGMVAIYLSAEQVAKVLYNASTMEEATFLPWYEDAKKNNPFNR